MAVLKNGNPPPSTSATVPRASSSTSRACSTLRIWTSLVDGLVSAFNPFFPSSAAAQIVDRTDGS